MSDYGEHCRKALELYGEHVFMTLASPDHFQTWVKEQKREDSSFPTVRIPKNVCRQKNVSYAFICCLRRALASGKRC